MWRFQKYALSLVACSCVWCLFLMSILVDLEKMKYFYPFNKMVLFSKMLMLLYLKKKKNKTQNIL